MYGQYQKIQKSKENNADNKYPAGNSIYCNTHYGDD